MNTRLMKTFVCYRSSHHHQRQYYSERFTSPPPMKTPYKIIIIIILICSGIYFLNIKSTSNTNTTAQNIYQPSSLNFLTRNHEKIPVQPSLISTKNELGDISYFVNTYGCRMPHFPVKNTEIKLYMHRPKKIDCTKPLISSNNNYVWISMSKLEMQTIYSIDTIKDLRCYYQAFRRKSDNLVKMNNDMHPINYGERVKVNDEFIRVICDYKNITNFHQDYHMFVPRKMWIEKNIRSKMKKNLYLPTKKYNVMVFGLDSMSRLNFQRQMPLSFKYLKDDMKAFEFLGFNKVGDNTYPNLIPTLTGFSEKELEETCLFRGKKSHYDNCYFIWKTFTEAGYITNFSEDVNYLGLFNFMRQGFIEQPTDYYLRPIFRLMENHIASQKIINVFMCLGGRHPFNIFTDYIRKFLHQLSSIPFFSFFWSTSMTHDDFNNGQYIDKDFLEFLRDLKSSSNNTIFMFMSDHGIRWGEFRETYQGMMEERQPMLYIILPDDFKSQYSKATNNLKNNAHRLITHFDIYETLKDLANTSTLASKELSSRIKEIYDAEPMPRGITLFAPIPINRTCEAAGIDDHWCTCHQKHIISQTDKRVQQSARYIVNKINTMLEMYRQCQTLYLMSISEAVLLTSNKNITKRSSTKSFIDITVRLVTKPGLGEFEGTIRHEPDDKRNMKLLLIGTISRINLYGKQSHCVDDYNMKLYCFCNR